MNNTTHLREAQAEPLRECTLRNSVPGEPVIQSHGASKSHHMRYFVKGDFIAGDGGLPPLRGSWGMANHIRAYRKKAGLTLEELASRIGMTDGNLSKLERGQIGYTQAAMESIARELGCKVTDLLSDHPPLTPKEETLLAILRSLEPGDQDRFIRMAGAFSTPTSSAIPAEVRISTLDDGNQRTRQATGRGRRSIA